jgi:signal transduction histidine kinase
LRIFSFTTVFVLLLMYAISALLFWGSSLQQQSRTIYEIEREDLGHQIDSVRQPLLYQKSLKELGDRLQKRRNQYIGEGTTLLAILLTGAVVVYTSLQRRARLQRQQSNFMLAVTHELKSPIAGMKLSIQTLQRHNLAEEQRNQLLSRCIQEADRLSELCNNMLVTSQIEGRQYKSANERLSFSDLVNDSAAVYSARYHERIRLDVEENCMIVGDMLLLHLAVNNLLENAIKYTPHDSVINIRLSKDNNQVMLQVTDNGGGIPDSEKKKIFSKFYRIGDEATRQTKGTGLGLYLTKRIVKQHKGRITVRDNQPSGAIFQINLPCA